jgi:acyl-CoA synthetase (AMP-forming)/AMP-acid ligase II
MSHAATIGTLFRSTVARHCDREAIVYRDTRWTYGELGDRVRTGSEVLMALTGTVPKRVAIVGANHPAYVVAYFAAQTLGASTVEIGRDESLDAIRRAVASSDAEAVLTDRPDLLAASGPVPALGFDALLSACESGPPREQWQRLNEPVGMPDAEASVVFTSGTTGSPKGVVLSQRNALFVVYAVCEYLALTPQDRYALVLPLAHTYGKSNLLSALASGAAVVFVERPQDAVAFFGFMAQERCTVLSVVPFHLNVLARRGVPESIDLTALRAITTSGGPLPDDAVRAVARLLPHAQLYSMYGLTESATRVTYLPPEWLSSKPGSVGRPLPGVRIEIRDDEGRALPAGTAGHVFVDGPNVMQGYLGEPEQTAATLVDGWLRTGDIGYLDADDCLFLTGRDKDIIKVAGERISPVEIEEVITLHPDVAEAAVLGMPDRLLGETVWAYIVPQPGVHDMSDVAAFCAARLSPHKVPRRFVSIMQIPRTSTGKVRRHMLKGL